MDKVSKRKEAEGSSLSRMGTAILKGNKVSVKWLPDESNELGYTSEPNSLGRTVNVAWYNRPYFGMLSQTEQSLFRMGVFAHELLHQFLTNFSYTNQICESMSQAEAAVFMKFANTLEDPAIEYFAPNIFGGRLLDALHFSIRHIYKLSRGIEHSTTPFSQLINALIHFGDMGIVKGTFTFPEAYEYFAKIAPLYNEGITCPDSKRRIDIAKECMELTRPLWEEDVKNREEFEKLLSELLKALETKGLHLFGNKEKSMSLPSEESEAGERRLVILEKMEKKRTSDDESDAGDVEKDGTTAIVSKDKEADNESDDKPDSESDNASSGKSLSDSKDKSDSGEGSSEKESSGSTGDSSGSSDTETETDSKAETDSGDSSSAEAEDSTESESSTKSQPDTSDTSDVSSHLENSEDGITTPENVANELADGEYVIDESVLKAVEESITAEERMLERKNKEDNSKKAAKDDPLPDFDISSTAFRSAKCLNQKVLSASAGRMAELYKQQVSTFSWEIKNLTKTLDRIFKSDMEELNRATSGSYNIKRGTIGTTARIFDKRREPGNLKDAAVVLAVDLSGSMSGAKIVQARKTCIVFAEALSALKIPYYIMGFSADMHEADAVHTHFVDWKGLKKDRESLIGMEARGNNFDGYSVRYAAELLKTRSASNKILFVISDGEPACHTYNRATGVADTTNAIKEARKSCTVFGIAVGTGCNPHVLQKMYGKDFIYCEDERLLSNTLCKKLEKVLKKGQ